MSESSTLVKCHIVGSHMSQLKCLLIEQLYCNKSSPCILFIFPDLLISLYESYPCIQLLGS